MATFYRYLLGAVFGFLVAMLYVNELPTRGVAVDNQALVETYRGMIERDDRILDVLLGGHWDRGMCYQRTPEELLADGSMRWSLRKVDCD